MPLTLRLFRADERFESPPSAVEFRPRWFWLFAALVGLAATGALVWTSATADTRALRALPDDLRLALYTRTLQNLRGTCDPAPPRSLRQFCGEQATLAGRFKECDHDQACQELVQRHRVQPRR